VYNFENKKITALLILSCSLLFFIMGFQFPLLQTGYGIGPITLKKDYIYLASSFRYFFDQGEVFIGLLLLFFTIIFPSLKYIFLYLTLLGRRFPRHHFINTAFEVINKWAMLDVFVVAVLILNMKFDSRIIISKLQSGTTLFAVSVVLLMISSLVAGKLVKEETGRQK
jgi:uncharacterized paraquat-inducible protein A